MEICPECGGELDEEGVCVECGFDTREEADEEEWRFGEEQPTIHFRQHLFSVLDSTILIVNEKQAKFRHNDF